MHSVMLFHKASIFIILEQQLRSNAQKLVSTLLKVLRAADEGNLVLVMTYVQIPLKQDFFLVLNRMPRQRNPKRGALYPPLHNLGVSNRASTAPQLR